MTPSLRGVHTGWAWVATVGNGVAGLWALGALRWPPLRRRALWLFTAAAEVTLFLEVVIGVVLVAAQDRSVDRFHTFYGFVALAAIGIIYSYRQQVRHRLYELYGLGGLFLMGLGIRAMLVGR